MSHFQSLVDMFAVAEREGWDNARLQVELVGREAGIADALRMAGGNLGADPAFVAKVIIDIGIGGPWSPEEINLINQQFAERLEFYRQQQQQPPDGGERGN